MTGCSDTDSRDYATVAELELDPGPWRRTNHSAAAPRQLTNHSTAAPRQLTNHSAAPPRQLTNHRPGCRARVRHVSVQTAAPPRPEAVRLSRASTWQR